MNNNSGGFCAQCGKPLNMGDRFCASCGAVQVGMQNQAINNVPVALSTPMALEASKMPVQKKSKKGFLWVVPGAIAMALVVIVMLLVLLNAGGKDRTIMVYMIGSDLEAEYAAASLDIEEMKGSTFDTEHTKVLIYTGGSKRWALDDISADENAIFEVVDGNINKVQVYEKKLMTDPSSLTEFIDFVYENYSSDLYDLVLWDHGGGPIFGYGVDGNSVAGATMKVSQLATALENTRFIKSGKKFEMVGFDACLMGSIETANVLKNYSNYMVASEEVEPGNGWNYAFLDILSGEEEVDAEKFGKNIIDYYMSHYDEYYYDVDLSLSMIDLNKLDKLIEPANELFSNVRDEINIQNFSSYSRKMTRKKVYGYSGKNSESYDLVDLMDLCESLEGDYGNEVAKVRDMMKEVVVYNRSNIEDTNGMSVYFLNYNKELADKMLAKYKDVAFSDDYYNFLVKYKDFITGKKLVSKTVYDDLKEEKQDGAIKIELPDELRDNYQSAELLVFRKLGDNMFMPIYRSSEVELAGNTLRATSYGLQFVIEVTTASGEVTYGWSSMFEKERTSEYADYTTFGVLYYNDTSSILGFTPQSYEMHIRVPNGSNEAEVRDIRVASNNDETGSASKMSFDPDRIKIINFVAGTYKLFNEAGEQDDNFESYGELYGMEADLEGGDKYKIKLVGLDFDFGNMYEGRFADLADYYVEFVVYDTQGEMHRLNLVHVDK